MKHPIQNTHIDKHGTLRFIENDVVELMRNLLNDKGIDLNELHRLGCEISSEDWDQFNQLTGYSVSGAPIDNRIKDAAEAAYRGKSTANNEVAKANVKLLSSLRKRLKGPVSDLYGIHPDDLL